MKRVLLICAGRAERWGLHLGVPKHLIEIEGERLIDRAVRLVQERQKAEIVIVAFDPAYDVPGTTRFAPEHGPERFNDTDKFLSSHSLWSPDDQTLILYGDVFFSERGMDEIAAYQGGAAFFGRCDRSVYTGCAWGELFALSFPVGDQGRLLEEMRAVQRALVRGDIERGGGWEVYRRMQGLPLTLFPNETRGGFIEIDDFTEDFDTPDDYWRWMRHRRWWKRLAGRRLDSWTARVNFGVRCVRACQKRVRGIRRHAG